MIKTAILPVAGMGTRFLPASKAQPKEMLAVVDKPVIQYIVEEAVASGIEQIIFVTAIGKRAIEDHFDRNFELEYRLQQKNKLKELEEIAQIGKMAHFAFVRQDKPLGDGHAVRSALPFLDPQEPVAVLFGDDIIAGPRPALAQLIDTYRETNSPVVALQEVERANVSQYGIVDGVQMSQKNWQIRHFVEKPKPEEAPSTMAAVGRYILTPDLLKRLVDQEPGKDGEIRLADAFSAHTIEGGELYGCAFEGVRYDCGSKIGFLKAQIELGLAHPDVGPMLRDYLRSCSWT